MLHRRHDVDGKAERRHLDLPGMHRQHRVADHQTAQRSVPPEIDARWRSDLIAPYTNRTLGRQCRTGRGQRADRAEIMGVGRANSGVRARAEKLRRRAEEGHPDLIGKIEESVRIRVRRAPSNSTSVAPVQARRKPVPHHPARGREVEDPVAGAEVGMETCSVRCFSSTPPVRCTMHLGLPVVPDENSTYHGCRTATART